jgi:hypothetical protein
MYPVRTTFAAHSRPRICAAVIAVQGLAACATTPSAQEIEAYASAYGSENAARAYSLPDDAARYPALLAPRHEDSTVVPVDDSAPGVDVDSDAFLLESRGRVDHEVAVAAAAGALFIAGLSLGAASVMGFALAPEVVVGSWPLVIASLSALAGGVLGVYVGAELFGRARERLRPARIGYNRAVRNVAYGRHPALPGVATPHGIHPEPGAVAGTEGWACPPHCADGFVCVESRREAIRSGQCRRACNTDRDACSFDSVCAELQGNSNAKACVVLLPASTTSRASD